MTDSSDSDDDDVQMQQLLQAADTSLFSNAMYQQSGQDNNYNNITTSPNTPKPKATVAAPGLSNISQMTMIVPKSERYLQEDEINKDNNFPISNEIQSHVWRKLTTIISEQVEFCDKHQTDQLKKNGKQKVKKSKVRLLQDADCYVRTYEDIVEEPLPKQVKPKIQPRQVDDDTKEPITKEILSNLAVSGEFIQAGSDTKTWAPQSNRSHKLFLYTSTSGRPSVLHLKQPENEFTELRRKRQWHANQIRQRIKK